MRIHECCTLAAHKNPLMATLQSLIERYVDADRPASAQVASCREIAKEILHGRLTMQNLVLTLGTYLTTTDNIVRARGTLLLSDILAELSAWPLEDRVIKTLTNFYSSRLGDWHCLRGALFGSLSLLRRTSNVGAVELEEGRQMARSALENLHVQALAQHDRMLCLQLFECLLDKHSAAVAPLDGDLVFGVVAAIEEEKDPRCLLLVFRIIELLARLYPDPSGPVATCAEDLFDIASRYFPISFNPQPGSPDGITRDDLAMGLKSAFVCTPLFAPFCIPLLLEKLSSSLRRAKLDSLNYLGHCALIYRAGTLKDYSVPVWEALKAELFPQSVLSSTTSEPKDAEVINEAMSCLTSWVAAFRSENDLSMVIMDNTGSVEAGGFLYLIMKDKHVEDLIEYVKNDTASTRKTDNDQVGLPMNACTTLEAEATGQVLAAAAQASPSSCFVVCKQVLTHLIHLNGVASQNGHSLSKKLSMPWQGRKQNAPGEVPELNISLSSPTGDSVAEVKTGHDCRESISATGLNVVLQVLIAAQRLATKYYQEQFSASQLVAGTWLNPLRDQSQDLMAAFCQAIAMNGSTDLPAIGVAGLQAFASFPASLSPLSTSQLRTVLSIFKELLMSDTTQGSTREKILAALENTCIAEEQTGAMGEECIGILTVVVPDFLEAVRETKTVLSVKIHLRALAKMCGTNLIAHLLVMRNLTETIHNELSGANVKEELGKVCGKLVCILQYLSEDILPRCDSTSAVQCAAAKLASEIWNFLQIQDLLGDEEVLKWSLEAMRAAVVKCDTSSQKEILEEGVKLTHQFKHISSHPCEQVLMEQVKHNNWRVCEEEPGWSKALVASVIVSLRPTTELSNRQVILDMMMGAAQSEGPSLVTETAAQAVGSLLNKWVDVSADKAGDFSLEKAIDLVLDEAWLSEITIVNSVMDTPARTKTGERVQSLPVQQKLCRVRAAAWVGKGLAMRGHSRVSSVASVLLRLLLAGTSEEGEGFSLALAAAQGLGIIMRDTGVCLNKEHYAVIRPLYKQRFFTSMLPLLMEAVRASKDNPTRLWLYRGVGQLVSSTPHVALLTDGVKVFPVLLSAISFLSTDPFDTDLLLSTLLALSSFLVDVNHGRSIAGEQVSSVVKRLLPLMQYQHSAVVRETSLQCLGAIVGLPYTQVYPLRAEVIKALSGALDDKKRVVRKEAVRCLQAWKMTAT